jgi:hypothetical protein
MIQVSGQSDKILRYFVAVRDADDIVDQYTEETMLPSYYISLRSARERISVRSNA